MSATHGEATARDGGDTNGGATTTVSATSDISGQLRRRRGAADRLPPLDAGSRDPLNAARAPHGSTCSRGYACLGQPLEVLERVHHCPCVEAEQAMAVIA